MPPLTEPREFNYSLHRRARLLGEIIVHVAPCGTIRVEAPQKASPRAIRNAVQKNGHWIEKKLRDGREMRQWTVPREYKDGETHFYLGKKHRLTVLKSGGRRRVEMEDGAIRVLLPRRYRHLIRRALDEWYARRAREYFGERVAVLTGRIAWLDSPPPFRVKKMRSQWGSCNMDGVLSLNASLVKCPPECIDYVIQHELCHLREFGHNAAFYRLLEECSPEWRSMEIELKGLEPYLLAD